AGRRFEPEGFARQEGTAQVESMDPLVRIVVHNDLTAGFGENQRASQLPWSVSLASEAGPDLGSGPVDNDEGFVGSRIMYQEAAVTQEQRRRRVVDERYCLRWEYGRDFILHPEGPLGGRIACWDRPEASQLDALAYRY